MKYIIEIDNNNITSEYGLFLIYESLFDARILLKEEIRKLTPYTEPDKESCQDCQFAKNPKTQEPCGRCSHSFYNFFRPKEQKKEEIKVGDEVLYEDEKGVVIVPEENGHYAAAFTAGGMRICEPDYKLRKTGKHYPEIVKILQEMRKK